jgi:hypothetical protein
MVGVLVGCRTPALRPTCGPRATIHCDNASHDHDCDVAANRWRDDSKSDFLPADGPFNLVSLQASVYDLLDQLSILIHSTDPPAQAPLWPTFKFVPPAAANTNHRDSDWETRIGVTVGPVILQQPWAFNLALRQ